MIYYRSAVVETSGEPLTRAAALAASGLFGTYVVYEGTEGWAIAGDAAAEIVVGADTVRCTRDGVTTEASWEGDPLDVVREFLAGLSIADWRAYGWCAFELSYALLGQPVDDGVLLHLVIPRTEVRFTASRAVIRSLDQYGMSAVEKELVAPLQEFTSVDAARADLEIGAEQYLSGVASVVRDIEDGLLQKAVLSRVVPLGEEIDFPASYVIGRRANTPARSFLLQMGGLRALGFSPETVVEVDAGRQVVSQPLAGTRALTGDPQTNRTLREDLLADPKELHEHAISVKVATDELVDPCDPESVSVAEFMVVKERGSVQHLASRVTGRLADGNDAWDAFRALFPAVTASGVPKRAAYDAIRAYETRPRGPYAGTVMTFSQDGAMDAALVLRSVYARGGQTWLQAGAGVVGHSRPERELEETREKLRCVAGCLQARSA
ncbi:salicylate synthase [Kitasatospora sp. NPDC048286]|uniref:salicylate synthase n=1 Tax=Kitasatospora sp. NPDC048286 TaxID=3364047 RepID=UPI003716FE42